MFEVGQEVQTPGGLIGKIIFKDDQGALIEFPSGRHWWGDRDLKLLSKAPVIQEGYVAFYPGGKSINEDLSFGNAIHDTIERANRMASTEKVYHIYKMTVVDGVITKMEVQQ